jgi:16S rRNA (guanine1516-N2)-methyltransferase
MSSPPPACEEMLHRLARVSLPGLRIQADALGVTIDHVDLQLRFQHSFIAGPIARRASQPRQLLLRACNNRQHSIHSVLDLTAGWGVDAYILARHGHDVTLLEQNELLHAIVDWSLQRLAHDPAGTEFARRLTLEKTGALSYLTAMNDRPFDCIYLDPMFPAHKSGAKPSKEMQILQALTDNRDIEACFELALLRARKRVVVKRAAKAPALGRRNPDLVQKAKSIRFDIYLTA